MPRREPKLVPHLAPITGAVQDNKGETLNYPTITGNLMWKLQIDSYDTLEKRVVDNEEYIHSFGHFLRPSDPHHEPLQELIADASVRLNRMFDNGWTRWSTPDPVD